MSEISREEMVRALEAMYFEWFSNGPEDMPTEGRHKEIYDALRRLIKEHGKGPEVSLDKVREIKVDEVLHGGGPGPQKARVWVPVDQLTVALKGPEVTRGFVINSARAMGAAPDALAMVLEEAGVKIKEV